MKIIRFITIAAVLGAFAASAHAEDTAPAPETAEPRSKLPDSEALDLSKAASQMQTADPTGWVGIRVAPLPEALATQLGLGEDVGVLVLNVIRNGPADKAGLQRYDVLVKREGKLIAADAAAFIADVVDRKPGSTLTLRVIRQSKQKTIPVIVGKPRTFNEVRYKYAPLEPTQQRQREVGGLQAQVLRRVDNNWVLEKDPNRVNRALSNLRTQDFATNSDRQSGSATAGENTALKRALPSEAVTWNNSRDVRVTVARTEDGLVVTKKPENRDANAQVDRYASEVDFKNSDRAT
ncbi:MAG: PDZ domain-containing protein, partial [Phycisphaerae bacterium]